MPLLDLIQFSRELTARRNKAALLLTPDLPAQRTCAEQIAAAVGAAHLDVLDRFQSDSSLVEQLAGFSADDLFKLLAAQKSPPSPRPGGTWSGRWRWPPRTATPGD